jgi:hypothetical protein
VNELDDEMPLALKKKKAGEATALPKIAQNSGGNSLASKVAHAQNSGDAGVADKSECGSDVANKSREDPGEGKAKEEGNREAQAGEGSVAGKRGGAGGSGKDTHLYRSYQNMYVCV